MLYNVCITDQIGNWLKTGLQLKEVGALLEKYVLIYEEDEDFESFLKNKGFLLDEEIKNWPEEYIHLDTEMDFVTFRNETRDKNRDHEEEDLRDGIDFNSVEAFLDYCKNKYN